MIQLTIRSDDKELVKRLKKLARKEEISLNQAALRLIKKGAEMNERSKDGNRIGSALNDFIGTWTAAEADELIKAVEDLRTIDENLWR